MSEFLDEKDKKILELESRRKLYELTQLYAGCHFREIERKSNMSAATVKYHLSYLSKHGLIKETKDNNTIRYFPREFVSEHTQLMCLLRQKNVRDILLFILFNPQCNHEQIVTAIKLSPSTVSWHLRKLETGNIIGFVKDGRKTCFSLLIDPEQIVKLFITYQQSFLDELVDRIIQMWDV